MNNIKKVKKGSTQNKETKSKSLIYIILLIIIVIAAFAKTSQFDFVDIDDMRLIKTNPLVTDSSIPYSQCFSKFIYKVHYKPLVFLSWKAEYELLGDNPSHFHTINWMLHLANVILLFFIGKIIFQRLFQDKKQVEFSAFALALLFAINPLHIESVAWATERKDVLFSFFFFIGWLLYLYYLKKEHYLILIISIYLIYSPDCRNPWH